MNPILAEPSSLPDTYRPFVTRTDGARIRYVEEKGVDASRVLALLEESRVANRWTNFGPVSRRLETRIHDLLRLPEELDVVMTASGSVALQALASLHETLADRPLRWLTSAFGYFTGIQGSLRATRVVDCDAASLLDLSLVDPDSVDGVIVTNTFGLTGDLERFRAWGLDHGKIVLVDAAMALASHPHRENEIVSFHHTKPWGFGEGGCAIIRREHAALFRSLISFGFREGEPINRRAVNGKISDPACAFHLVRLEQTFQLRGVYREQYRRIAEIGRSLGLALLGGVEDHPGIATCVAFQLPVEVEKVDHRWLPTGRYYYPLEPTPTATRLYQHMLNVPCHLQIAELTDEEIRGALTDILARA